MSDPSQPIKDGLKDFALSTPIVKIGNAIGQAGGTLQSAVQKGKQLVDSAGSTVADAFRPLLPGQTPPSDINLAAQRRPDPRLKGK